MNDIFQSASRPKPELFYRRNDVNDIRLGDVVEFETAHYESSDIVILGCPQDEGVARNGGRVGAKFAPDAIRTQFYKLTNFGIDAKIFDLGDTLIHSTLEKTHDAHTKIVAQLLGDEKCVIVLGGGNDISYADGKAMAQVFGSENWLGMNIDAHFDVRVAEPRNSGTPYRQLLDENLIQPENFFETAWQRQANSQVYFDYLQNLNVNLISLEEMQKVDFNFQQRFSTFDRQQPTFFGFDVDAVRAADAPGVSASSPLGLSAEEFVALAKFAGDNKQTKIIEFTELNPNFDVDNHTAKLVAVAAYEFCAAKRKS